MLVRPVTHEEPTILPLEIHHTLMSVYERIAQVINVSPALRVAACAVFGRRPHVKRSQREDEIRLTGIRSDI